MAKPVYTIPQVSYQLQTQWQDDEGVRRVWLDSTVHYSIPFAPPEGNNHDEEDGFVAMSGYQRAMAALAFELWDDLIAIDLIENLDTEADITFAYSSTTNDDATYASSFTSSINSNYDEIDSARIWLSTTWTNLDEDSDIVFGSSGFGLAYIHEIGHSLGLSHPGSYGAFDPVAPTYDDDAEYAQDTAKYTVMSYFAANSEGTANHMGGDGMWKWASTPLLHDILAIQNKYGADPNTRTGDTVYGFNSNIFNRDMYNFAINTDPVIAIYDAGGVDTLDVSGFAQNQFVDLRWGTFSSIGALTQNVAVAYHTVIENAVGGSGNDTIQGNHADNLLRGLAGSDLITGGFGRDTLEGGDNGDILIGSQDDDLLDGGNYDDNLQGGIGNDTIIGGAGGDAIYGGSGDDTIVIAPGLDSISDTISGGESDEILGDTLLVQGTFSIILIDFSARASGIEIWQGNGFGLEGQFGDLGAPAIDNEFDLRGLTAISGLSFVNGDKGNDTIHGSQFADDLRGGSGFDTLHGWGGNDTIDGGQHSDRLLGGDGDDSLDGSLDDDTLLGGADDDTLNGGDGNDRLDGGTGSDAMAGGDGDDVYVVDDIGDAVDEAPSSGHDRVIAYITLALAQDFEDLTLAENGGAIDGSGTGLANRIVGNSSDNELDGGGGADTLIGGDGQDTLIGADGDDRIFGEEGFDSIEGGAGNDTLRAGFGNDTIEGGADNDLLYGEAGDDQLSGGAGVDTLNGGDGDDRITVRGADDTHDVIRAGLTGEGSFGDTLVLGGLSSSVTLSGLAPESGIDRIEGNLKSLSGTEGNDAFVLFSLFSVVDLLFVDGAGGNDTLDGAQFLADDLRGGDGDDLINGNFGSDTLVGGSGNDTLDGGFAADTIAGGAGIDVMTGGVDIIVFPVFSIGGPDVFLFASPSDSGVGAGNRDVITDFTLDIDTIDLSAIDADILSEADAFTFSAAGAFSSVAGELIAYTDGGNTIVAGDIDGDAVADFEIELTGAVAVTETDFVL